MTVNLLVIGGHIQSKLGSVCFVGELGLGRDEGGGVFGAGVWGTDPGACRELD